MVILKNNNRLTKLWQTKQEDSQDDNKVKKSKQRLKKHKDKVKPRRPKIKK